MNLHDFYYELPQELIAQDPLEDRSGGRGGVGGPREHNAAAQDN